MSQQDTIAVVGAGVIGAAVTLALVREGRKVLLLDRAAPGIAGASFGNAGHIAVELVQPLPSPGLLFGFWRDLFLFGGALDLPAREVLGMLPWIRRFAAAALRRDANTPHLAPLVLPAADSSIRAGFDALVNRLGVRPRVVAEVDDMAMLRLLARERIGLAVVPTIVVQDELHARVLVEIAPLPQLKETFFAITLARRFPNPLLKILIAHRDRDGASARR